MTSSETEFRDDAPIANARDGTVAATAPGAEQGDSVSYRAVTINRPSHELYAYWREIANLATFMENVVSVEALDETRSHWVIKAPAGKTVEWDAELTEDVDGKVLAWQSVDGADVANSGRVEFRDAGVRGSVVTLTVAYDPPAGVVGKMIAKVFQREPAIQARRDLRRFKQLMETGEIAVAARTRAQFEKERG